MTTRVDEDVQPEVRELSAEEAAELFEQAAQQLLGLSGAEFLSCWDRGDYDDETENMAVTKVAMLIPFVR